MRQQLREGRRPHLTAGEVSLLMGSIAVESVYIALKALRAAGLVRYVPGSCRLMELAPGAPAAIFDGRGRNPASRNLKRNTKASMSTSRRVKGRAFVRDY